MKRFPCACLVFLVAAAVSSCRKAGEFRHAQHLAVTEGACDACHGPDTAAPRAAAPADCDPCHKGSRSLDPEATARYGSPGTGPARRVPAYADVKFSHRPHADAGFECPACHGPSRWQGNRVVLPAMDECRTCHAREGSPNDCATCHATIRKFPARPPG